MGERQRACKREGQSPRERAKRARRTFEHQARPLKHRPRTTAFTVPVPTAATAATAATTAATAVTAAAAAATAATTTHGRCIAEPCDGVAGWVDAIHGEPPPQRWGKQIRSHACTRAHTHTRTNAHVVPLVATVGGCGCVIVAAGAPALGFYACMQRLQPPRLWPVPVHGLDTLVPKTHNTTRCVSRTDVVPRKTPASTPKLLTWRAKQIRDIVSEPLIYICRNEGF